MQRPKRWTIAETNPLAEELAARLKISTLVSQILLNRGMIEIQDCQDFLKPSLKCLHDPALLANLPAASQRIAKSIRDREKIVVYGDYDVDGITATSILWHAIRTLGGIVEYYIPHRLEEGYGLNAEAVAEICDGGAKLIVTVDCGVTALGPAKVARDRGVDLIITDHHEWHEQAAPLTTADDHEPLLPQCYAIVHPRLPGANGQPYPNPSLCGAGVAFKLAWGIGTAMSGANRVNEEFRAFLLEATGLAALGTIADVVPLIGENRVLAAFGLSGLRQSRLTGIKALIESASLAGQALDAYHVGFLLAPRINASGRMGHAKLAVELLTEASPERATEIATFLEQQNRERQGIEKGILQQAIEQATALGYDNEDCRAIVLGAEGWHAGVIGIVASRIVDRFHRPTIMIALNNGHGQGSGRSVAGFHLARALEACSDHLDGYGGHEMAAGLKIDSTRFEGFRSAFCEYATRTLQPEQLVPELKVEAVAEIRQVSQALVTDLQRLGPFGHGNRRPVLCCRDVIIAAPPRRVGKSGDHLQLFVRQGMATMKCIAFNRGAWLDQLTPGTRVDLAVEPTLNEFNGRTSVEMEIKDLHLHG
ncbi:MAG TPA: single-stranded-DNA-specific exonuclease RecJ [Tepidisphaeraceae bacterium]|nr:single-stranded-DNA-specific exonuclease RecJ [Tepidisphaeraceae bacterium]